MIQETFISTDDLSMNLWNFERNDIVWKVVDIEPPDIQDLEYVLTSSIINPKDNNMFLVFY
jgi:hypothetical protein